MPISQFPEWLQKAIAFLPGTYGMSLLRNHAMSGTIRELEKTNMPEAEIKSFCDAIDCNIYFFDKGVEMWQMYLVMGGFTAIILVAYILLNLHSNKKSAINKK